MLSQLYNLWGRITGADAGEEFPKQQGSVLSRPGDFFAAQPYGLYANLPEGQLFKVIDEDGRVVLGVTVERPNAVEQGEITLHHPATGSLIHLKNSGDIDITAPTINLVGQVEVTGGINCNGTDIGDTHTHTGSPSAPSGGISNTGTPT